MSPNPTLRAILERIQADPTAPSFVISHEMARDLREHFESAGTFMGDGEPYPRGGILVCYGRIMLKASGKPWRWE